MSDVTCAEAGERSHDVVAVAASLADYVELAKVSAELGGVPLAQVAQAAGVLEGLQVVVLAHFSSSANLLNR